MEISIIINKDSAGIRLFRGVSDAIDSVDFNYYHDLGFQLIKGLDNLFKKHKIDLAHISSFSIQGDAGPESTGYKIAQSFIEGLQAMAIKPKK